MRSTAAAEAVAELGTLGNKIMIDPFQEVLRRFPEIEQHLSDGDEDSPYLYFGYIAWWIESLSISEVSDDIIQRISSFGDWCCSQPEGKDASDDLATILMVGLYESLGSSEGGRKILSRIWEEEYVLRSEEYLRQWLGDEAYQKLLAEYKKPNKPAHTTAGNAPV